MTWNLNADLSEGTLHALAAQHAGAQVGVSAGPGRYGATVSVAGTGDGRPPAWMRALWLELRRASIPVEVFEQEPDGRTRDWPGRDDGM